jgi:glycosyltransferase involved in cell wall biosynthesis
MAKLAVFSHKPCWSSDLSPSGYATDGGFAFQMQAISELFESTNLLVPCSNEDKRSGENAIAGHNLTVVPLSHPTGSGVLRKLTLSFWLLRHSFTLAREIRKADAIHTPIPGDIGTIGILLALIFNKPLFVRYCGNWFVQKTFAERFWKWLMERLAGGKNIMLVTGGANEPPSQRNPNLEWIFSTSLTEKELNECKLARRQISAENIRLIIACRQEKGKGTEVVIQSLPLLLADFPNATLDIIGDGTALAGLKELAKNLSLSQRIRFHGKVNHETVIKLLKEAQLFCYPTASEGFPKVVLEALACGLPVITTPVSVLPQLVNAGCGLLIKETTPEALAQAVRSCLKNPDHYVGMSRCAIQIASQYSLERWREEIGYRLRAAWGILKANA